MYKEILIPVDLDEPSSWERALPVAVEQARAFGARLHVMTVLPDFGSPLVGLHFPRDFMEKAVARANERLHALVRDNVPEGVAVQHVVREGSIYLEIVRAAEEVGADLIVMASHRPALRDYLLGPNAARVVRHSDRSVLVVR